LTVLAGNTAFASTAAATDRTYWLPCRPDADTGAPGLQVPLKQWLLLLLDMARGYAAGHAAGLLNLDAKPANVFLRLRDGTPEVDSLQDALHGSHLSGVVGDYGVAVARKAGASGWRRAPTLVGTVPYAAPEVQDARLRLTGGVWLTLTMKWTGSSALCSFSLPFHAP
jgi:hypothetical protein